MKENFTALETLLYTDSSFLQNASLLFKLPEEGKTLSYKEQIIEACWNGEMAEILPEAFCLGNAPYLYLWNVLDFDKTVVLESADTIYHFQHEININPHRIDFNLLVN